jgi:HK97 family phage prohead protease
MLEVRFNRNMHLRESQGDEGSVITGYAARFGTLSEDLGGFRETIIPGAFKRSLQTDRDVKALFNHDPAGILGRKKYGTLRVSEMAGGLHFRCVLPDTQTGRDVATLIKRGDVDSCSFAFEVDGSDGEQWSDVDDPLTGDRIRLRSLVNVKLHDVSVLSAAPAYPTGTSVEVNHFPELNSLARSVSDYFPTGVPVSFPTEIRASLLRNQHQSSKAREARQKLFSLVLS